MERNSVEEKCEAYGIAFKKLLLFWLFLPLHGWKGDGLVFSSKTLCFEFMGPDMFRVRSVLIRGRHLGQEYPSKLCAVGWAVEGGGRSGGERGPQKDEVVLLGCSPPGKSAA